MHLNNEQLLEPGETDLLHISDCSLCRSRIKNLGLIRERLQTLGEDRTGVDQWNEIKRDYQTQTNITQLNSARKRTVFWRITSGALAASIVLFVMWQSFYVLPISNSLSQSASFAALIEENHSMQRLLSSQLTAQRELNSRTAGLLVELDIINTKLEKAYLEKEGPEQKLMLWQKRQALLETALNTINQPHVIKI